MKTLNTKENLEATIARRRLLVGSTTGAIKAHHKGYLEALERVLSDLYPKEGTRAFSEKWLREFAARLDTNYEQMMADLKDRKTVCFGDDDGPNEVRWNPEFWTHVGIVLEREISDTDKEDQNFRCAC
jgi:hypothetical protein